MKRQRNTTQMKEQIRNTEVQTNEEEISKLPEKEFKIMIIKVIKNLENKMEKMQESIKKEKIKWRETTYSLLSPPFPFFNPAALLLPLLLSRFSRVQLCATP